MLRASQYLVAKTGPENQIWVTTKSDPDTLTLIGTTIRSSLPSEGNSATSFTLFPEKGEQGLIAVSVFTQRFDKKRGDHFYAMLLVSWNSEDISALPRIDLEEEFVPINPVSIGRDKIVALVGDRWVDSCSYSYSYGREEEKPTLYVPDTRLLLLYAMDKATAEDVMAAVVQRESETKQVSLEQEREQLLRQKCTVEGELAETRRALDDLKRLFKGAESLLTMREREIEKLKEANKKMTDEVASRLLALEAELRNGSLSPFCSKRRVAAQIGAITSSLL